MNASAQDVQDPQGEGRSRVAWVVVLVVLLVGAFGLGRLTSGGDAAPEHVHGEDSASTWTCSMHPQIQMPEFGACPICGMDLIALDDKAGGELTPDQIRLSSSAKALARIETMAVGPMPNQGVQLRLLGRLDKDESKVRTVTSWTSGRIDRLRVASTGAKVARNQVIATLYSPEIYAAQRDLLQARRQLESLGEGLPMARSSADATRRAARQRLRLLGVGEGELDRMERAKAAWRQVQIRSPFAGTVTEKIVTEGQYVGVGEGIYRLVDLSSLWVQLDAYEQDLSLLGVGQEVALSFEAYPGEIFQGRVAFIDPVVDVRTRTAKVRVEVGNEDGRLRPGMFAEAVVGSDVPGAALPSLVIPASAPLFSGRRSLVYVEVMGAEEPTYEAREVRLGIRVGDHYPVVAGLEYGERVVIHGAFRLDADLQIRGGRSLMARPDDTRPAAFDQAVTLSPVDRERLVPLFNTYLDAQEALAADDLKRARGAVDSLVTTSGGVSLETNAARAPWVLLQKGLQTHGRYFVRASGLAPARAAFASLTQQMSQLMEVFGNPLEQPVRLVFCPMAFGNRGAQWFQRGEQVNNTYYGKEMLQCGEVRDSISGGAFKAATQGAPTSQPSSAPASAPASAPVSAPGSAPGSEPASAPGAGP